MLSAFPSPSKAAFLGAAEPLWDLALATGGAVAALESILGVGCGVEEEGEPERGTSTYTTGIWRDG